MAPPKDSYEPSVYVYTTPECAEAIYKSKRRSSVLDIRHRQRAQVSNGLAKNGRMESYIHLEEATDNVT